jgi:signal peptidase I
MSDNIESPSAEVAAEAIAIENAPLSADEEESVAIKASTPSEPKGKVKKKGRIKSIITKILMGIGIAVCAFLVVTAACLAWDKFVNRSPAPGAYGYSMLIIGSGSMSGTIEQGDMVVITKTNDYKIGDIITFIHDGEQVPTTHRIVAYDRDGETVRFVTKGDYNSRNDSALVSEEEVLGEVVCHWRVLGLIVGWLKDGGGLIYLIAVIAVVGFGVYLLKQEKQESGKNTENTEKTENTAKTENTENKTEKA